MAARRGLPQDASYLDIVQHDARRAASRVVAAPPQQPAGGAASEALAQTFRVSFGSNMDDASESAARLGFVNNSGGTTIPDLPAGARAPTGQQQWAPPITKAADEPLGVLAAPAGVDLAVWADLPRELQVELRAELGPALAPEPESGPEPEPEPQPQPPEGVPGAQLQRTTSGSFRAAEAQLHSLLSSLPQPSSRIPIKLAVVSPR